MTETRSKRGVKAAVPKATLAASLAAAASVGLGLIHPLRAHAGHPIGSDDSYPVQQPGDCIYSHGYINCYDWYRPYAGTRFPLYLRSIRQTDAPSFWDPLIAEAEANWNAADGPQSFSPLDRGNPQSYVYYNTAQPYKDPLAVLPPKAMITYRCSANWTPSCRADNYPGTIQWAEIWIDANFPGIACDGRPELVSLLAHEEGHALNLWHHGDSSVTGSNYPLMTGGGYLCGRPAPAGPGPEELGSTTNCRYLPVSSYATFGIRCIYQYYPLNPTAVPTATNTPAPTAVPTATSTPIPPGGK